MSSEHRPIVEVDVNMMSESNLYAGLSGDASEGGLFYATYARLTIGMEVELELGLWGFGAPMFLIGRVAWIREHSDDQPRGAGIAFTNLTDDNRETLRAFTRLRAPLYCDDDVVHVHGKSSRSP